MTDEPSPQPRHSEEPEANASAGRKHVFEIVPVDPLKDQKITTAFKQRYKNLPKELREYFELEGYRLEIEKGEINHAAIHNKNKVINFSFAPSSNNDWPFYFSNAVFKAALKLFGNEVIKKEEWEAASSQMKPLMPRTVEEVGGHFEKLSNNLILAYIDTLAKDDKKTATLRSKIPISYGLYERFLKHIAAKTAELHPPVNHENSDQVLPQQQKKNYSFTEHQALVSDEMRKGHFVADLQRVFNAINPDIELHKSFGDAIFADAVIEVAKASKRAGTSTNGKLTGEQTALADMLDIWEREEPEKLQALQAAKTQIEAILTLKERDAPKDWQQHQRLQKAIRESSGYIGAVTQAEAKVAGYKSVPREYVIPHDFIPPQAVLEEIEPIRTELNAWHDFDKRLGGSLFAKSVLQRAAWAAFPKEGKSIPSHEGKGPDIADGLGELFQRTEKEYCSEDKERFRNLEIVCRLRDSTPLLVVAALGTDAQLRELRNLYHRSSSEHDKRVERRESIDRLVDKVLIEAGLIPSPQETASPLPLQETSVAKEMADYQRPVEESIRIAKEFAQSCLKTDHTLFACHVDPALGRHNPVVMKMYKWGLLNDGRLKVQRPPEVRPIGTGTSLAHARHTMQQIQLQMLRMAGVTAYARTDDPRRNAPADIMLPDPRQNRMRDEIMQNDGMWELRIEYDQPQHIVAKIPLGLTQSRVIQTHAQPFPLVVLNNEAHYEMGHEAAARDARERADQVIQHIHAQHQQFPGALVTQNDVSAWLYQQHQNHWESPILPIVLPEGEIAPRDHAPAVHHISVAFPQGETSIIAVGSPSLEGYPDEEWKLPISIIYDGHTLKQHTFNPHARGLFHAYQRRDQIVSALKFLLENEADRGHWALTSNNRLQNFVRQPLEGPPHDVDESRLATMFNMAAAFETCYEPVIRSQETLPDGRHAVKYGLRRIHQGQSTDEWFYTESAQHGNRIPKVLERTVEFPVMSTPGGTEAAVAALTRRMQRVLRHYLREDYSSVTIPHPTDHVQNLRKKKTYDPDSFRNLLGDAIIGALADDRNHQDYSPSFPYDPSFASCKTPGISRSTRRNGGGGSIAM